MKVHKGDFSEGDHPRADNGEFGEGGGGAAPAPAASSSAHTAPAKPAAHAAPAAAPASAPSAPVNYDVKGKSDAAKVRNFIANNPGMSTSDHLAAGQKATEHKEKMLHLLAARQMASARVADLKGEKAKVETKLRTQAATTPATVDRAKAKVQAAQDKVNAARAKLDAVRARHASERAGQAADAAAGVARYTPAQQREIAAHNERARALQAKKSAAIVPASEFHYSGPSFPKAMFILCDGVTPTPEERLRARPIVNEDAVAFEKRYLAPLGLARGDVGIAWCTVDSFDRALESVAKHKPEVVISLGSIHLSKADGSRANLPKFVRAGDVWKSSFKEEVDRKLKGLRAKLDARAASVRPSLRPLLKAARPQDGAGISNAKILRLYKSLAPKRIVYGVVLDPYVVDLQGDWIPPADVEETAHNFLAKNGYISDRHEAQAPDAKCVESSVEQYPSQDDYEKAMRGLPHRVYRRKFGNDFVCSGSWVMGVKLSEPLWESYQRGELDAFSIEGFGSRTEMQTGEMPEVTFVDLEAVS